MNAAAQPDPQGAAVLFDDKEHATLAAEFALAGVELVRLADGTWIASRWGKFKPLASAEEARCWLARVTGRPA